MEQSVVTSQTIKTKQETQIGFLLINSVAHLYHAASIALELSYIANTHVILYISTLENKEVLEKLAQNYLGNRCEFCFLKPSLLHKISRLFKKRLHPRVQDIIRHNKKQLLANDALIMTDKHMLKYHNKNRPKYISVGHGAGDRATAFKSRYKDFDYLLVSGEAKWKRMQTEGIVSNKNGKIIGYPKFDCTLKMSPKTTFFKNNKPIVIYNPHFNQSESSWTKWGEYILNYFYNSQDYNLIFAPHILLFSKTKKGLTKKYSQAKNIYIDLESHNLTDMSYTRIADIYLGDVSSQVYEFIGYKNRPCLFLNPNQEKWMNNNNFRMWNMGDVISDIDTFDSSIKNAKNNFINYAKTQDVYSKETFSTAEIPASQRAAKAISEFMKRGKTSQYG